MVVARVTLEALGLAEAEAVALEAPGLAMAREAPGQETEAMALEA